MYCSPLSQNALIKAIGNCLKRKIFEQVKEAGYFSIMADETMDIASKEQLSITLRFLSNYEINETFIGFVELSSATAKSITTSIVRRWTFVD